MALEVAPRRDGDRAQRGPPALAQLGVVFGVLCLMESKKVGKPQTLAYALTDSPVGQLAWIVEKFKEWTHAADVPEDAVDGDQLLTNVMLYWLTGTANSSGRMYYENMHAGFSPQQPGTTPTGVAVFAEDYAIRRYGERSNNIVHWSEFDRGGHFPAMEVPELLVGDIRAFFRRLR